MKTLIAIIILFAVGCSKEPEDNTIGKDGGITDEEFKRLQKENPEYFSKDKKKDKWIYRRRKKNNYSRREGKKTNG